MGKGRDKRKKHEDPAKASKRAAKQSSKLQKSEKKAANGEGDGSVAAASSTPGGGGFNNEESVEVMVQRIRKAEEKEKRKTTIEKETVLPPSPRANVVMAPHPNREHEILVFGGELWNGVTTVPYNDLFVYHTQKRTWSQIITPVTPAPRSSAQGITYKQFLLIFGGEFVSPSQSQFMHFRDVWRYDSGTGQWEELKNCVKRGPSARSGHRMALWRKNAVLFGGFYDNALECKYFNDLWVLTELDGQGRWLPIEVPEGQEAPHARSGHCVGVCNEHVFVYGGYSAEKFNRFKKTEATVHHDLWTMSLANSTYANPQHGVNIWQKVKLAGIPPPIRSGVACATYNKKFLLFGGVVDIESSGGKLTSTFHNDLFEFNMESQRFYPLVLRSSSKSAATAGAAGGANNSAKAKAEGGGNTLAAELEALNIRKQLESDSSDDDGSASGLDDDDGSASGLDDDEGDAAAATDAAPAEASKFSYEPVKGRPDQLLPHRRMDASLVVVGNTLFVFGGQFEAGKKEVTISDLFALNLNQLHTYVVHHAQNLAESQWLGKEDDSEDDKNSWESGSTVLSANLMDNLDDDDDDDEDLRNDDEDLDDGEGLRPLQPAGGIQLHVDPMHARAGEDGGDDDDDEVPDAIPADIGHEATPGNIPFVARPAAAAATADFRKNLAKKGLQNHKYQLQCQLSAEAAVPTPLHDERLKDFYARTEEFWLSNARDALFGGGSAQHPSAKKMAKQCASEAMKFARIRFDEATQLMAQLNLIEAREQEEAAMYETLREQRRLAAAASGGPDGDDVEEESEAQRQVQAPLPPPVAATTVAPLKSAMKQSSAGSAAPAAAVSAGKAAVMAAAAPPKKAVAVKQPAPKQKPRQAASSSSSSDDEDDSSSASSSSEDRPPARPPVKGGRK